ncbi:MAG TPA: hypothetical protein PK961_09480 [bacterium]|nr:hypothetical protein [bacterium]
MSTPEVGAQSRNVQIFPIIYGLIHALIDATTVAVIFQTRSFHHLDREMGVFLILAYDLLAFAGQTPLGWLLDRLRIWRGTAVGGIVICAAAMASVRLDPLTAMILASVGNAAFHVGSGALVLHADPGRATPAGIFVAPGALGLALGIYFGKSGMLPAWPYYLLLGLAVVAALWTPAPDVQKTRLPKPDIDKPLLIVLLLLFSIVVRSLVGKAGGYALPKETAVLFGVAAAAFAGKAFGGILSDRFGWIKISVGALLISAPLLAFGKVNVPMIVVGMFLFQMTMPVTLVAVYSLMPGRPGLAFGLNCLAYIAGFFATKIHGVRELYNPVVFLVLILLSATAVYLGLRPLQGKVRMRF